MNNYDYNGNMKKFQDKLEAIGITKDQLDMSNYSGLTEKELMYIVDNPQYFIKKSSSELLELLNNFKAIKRSVDLSDEAFTKILAASSFANEIDCLNWSFPYPTGYLIIYKTLQSTNVDEYISLFKHIEKEYDQANFNIDIKDTCNFDTERYSGSNNYQVFAGIAEITISKTYMDNSIFRNMLLTAYKDKYGD